MRRPVLWACVVAASLVALIAWAGSANRFPPPVAPVQPSQGPQEPGLHCFPIPDPAPLSSHFAGRQRGGAEAVDAGLDWLKRHQSPEGFWDCDGFERACKQTKCGGSGAMLYDAGVSGLATLAFLGTGETHDSPRHGETLRRSLKYLKAIQDHEGCFGGARVERGWGSTSNKFTYGHAIATLAMVEAYGMTGSPLFRASAQRGVDFIQECRNPYLAWRYGVRPQDNDTSVTGWMVMALRVAKEAGLEVDPAAFDGAVALLDKVIDPGTGRSGYTARDNGPSRPQELIDRFPADQSESLTAEAIFARILCGAKPEDGPVAKGADLCMKILPRWDAEAGTIDFCYWHFGSLAMFQVGGDRWTRWNAAMTAAVEGAQRRDAADDRHGSWDPADPWGKEGGRVYSTAINVLTLETAARYTKFGPAR